VIKFLIGLEFEPEVSSVIKIESEESQSIVAPRLRVLASFDGSERNLGTGGCYLEKTDGSHRRRKIMHEKKIKPRSLIQYT
jgi:hypothetical protein